MIVDVFLLIDSYARKFNRVRNSLFCFSPHNLCSAYNIFFKEERQKIMSQEHKSLGFENLAKTIGGRWKQMLSDEERAPYKEKAAVSFFS